MKKIKEKQTKEMKANENKIKDRENSKSDLISFSSNLKFFF